MKCLVAVCFLCVACSGTEDRASRARRDSHASIGSSASSRTWSLELPNGWHEEGADRIVSFSRPNGVGALQVSAYFRDEPITEEHLRELAEDHLSPGAVAHPVQLGVFVGFQITYAAQDSFWSEWYVRHDRQALFITYNCRSAERGPEYDEVKRALGTLKVVDPRRAG